MICRAIILVTGLAVAVAPEAWAQTAARRESPVRGVVRPVDQASVATDLSARVVRLTRKEGESFKKGDLLVEFDCRRHKSEYAASEAMYREAKIAHQSQLYLQRNQAGAKFDVDVAEAKADKAKADMEALFSRLDQCVFVAPFSGRVAELAVHVHEMPQAGKPYITILDDSSLEVELIVPSSWLRWLRTGASFRFNVDETGQDIESKILRMGAAVDPVSQTVKIVGVLVPDGKVLAGMSGTAEFSGGQR